MGRFLLLGALALVSGACSGDSGRVDNATDGSSESDTATNSASSGGSWTGGDPTAAIDCDKFETNLPLVFIETGGRRIPDEPKIDVGLRVVDNGEGHTNCWGDPPAFEGAIGIEIRGSTSQMYPKQSFGVETRDALGRDVDVPMFGMPAESDWVLYAPYPDKTMIRNALTFHLHTEMGHYSSRARYVEVILDGDYWGVYVWMEKIKRGSGRVAITGLNPTDVTGDAVTGGYILKVDKLTGDVGANWISPYSDEVTLQVHYPKGEDIVGAQAQYIEGALTALEDILAGPNYADAQQGYPSQIDTQSFIDFMILQELGRTVDGYRSSSFLYKDRDSVGGKFVAGPMWDFNLSFGNADYCEAFSTRGYQYNFEDICANRIDAEVPFWWRRLLEDPDFSDALRCRWESLRSGPLSDAAIAAFVDAKVAQLANAQVRNFERWPILGEYVDWNWFIGETYEEEVEYLLTWIGDRTAWLDDNFGGTC